MLQHTCIAKFAFHPSLKQTCQLNSFHNLFSYNYFNLCFLHFSLHVSFQYASYSQAQKVTMSDCGPFSYYLNFPQPQNNSSFIFLKQFKNLTAAQLWTMIKINLIASLTNFYLFSCQFFYTHWNNLLSLIVPEVIKHNNTGKQLPVRKRFTKVNHH